MGRMTATADARSRLGRLPDQHLAALRAVLSGFDDDQVALLLGIPVEAVPTTLHLAAAKLAAALGDGRHGVSASPADDPQAAS
jgi:DNA-directed RNA polymerase specialized sigma24 family protein